MKSPAESPRRPGRTTPRRQEAEDDDLTTTPEVSEDEAAAAESDDDSAEDVYDEWHAFSDLGRLNLHPGSVAYIFARQAERER